MKTKNYIFISLVAVSFSLYFIFSQWAFTQVISGIDYPVAELGGCESELECRSYCDNEDNAPQCLDFAQKHNLMTAEEIRVARLFLIEGIQGPGQCTTKESCRAYCDNIERIDECIDFAQNYNLLQQDKLQEYKQIQAALERGIEPLPCRNKDSCELYCEEPANMRQCIDFGREAGFLKGQDLEDAQKMLNAIERGLTPPPCRGRDSCEQYCSEPQNMESCMNFALEAVPEL